MTTRALLLATAVTAACGAKKSPPAATAIECFDATAATTSAQARATFEARHCQAGGVTWAAILDAFAHRRGTVDPVDAVTPGYTGSVSTLNHAILFSIDDEGDAARFCTADHELLVDIHAAYDRANKDALELRRAMAEAPPDELECGDDDHAIAARLAPDDPDNDDEPPRISPTTPTTADETRLLAAALAGPWCLPSDDVFHETGQLVFSPDGRVTLARAGQPAARVGHWNLPLDTSRTNVVELMFEPTSPTDRGLAYQLDLDAAGALGFSYVRDTKRRETLLTGAACPPLAPASPTTSPPTPPAPAPTAAPKQ